MKIQLDTLPLRRFSRLIASVVEPGNQIYESVFIDLKNKQLFFVTSHVAGCIKLEIKDTSKAITDDGFFIPADRFFTIVNAYPEITFDKDDIITSDGKFTLGVLRDPYEFPKFTSSLKSSMKLTLIGDDTSKKFAAASSFVSKDPLSPVNGLFIKNGHIIGTDRILMYDDIIGGDVKKGPSDFSIPLSVWAAVSSLPFESIKISWENKLLHIESDDKTFMMNASVPESFDVPDPTDPGFRSAFDHETIIKTSRQGLVDMLKFFDAFTRVSPHNRLKLMTPSESEIVIAVVDGSNASRRLPAVVSKALVGDGYTWFSSKNLLKALEALEKVEEVSIALAYGAQAVDIRTEGSNMHVVLAPLEE